MKHIVIDARESGTSTGRYVDKLVEHLHALQPKHDITLLAKSPRLEFLRNIAPNFTVVRCDVQEFTLAEQTTLQRQLDALAPDLVHFTIVQQPAFYRGLSVTTMHDLTTVRFRNPAKNAAVFWTKQQIYKWLNKRVAQKSSAVLTPTEFVKQEVAAYCRVPPGKITVTPEAAEPITEAAEPFVALAGKQFLLYTGRPTPHKNLQRLIEAFAVLHQTHSDVYLVLAGKTDTNYASHEARVKKRGIPNVIFTGYVSDGQLRWLYENCAAYVFPSLSEGFGLPGLEAMTHGAPVVSSNATCLPEVYGTAAHYFDPLSVSDMAEKIDQVLDNPQLRNNLVARGAAQIKKYSWWHMAEQTLGVYEASLQKRA